MKINQVLVESAQATVAFAFGRFNPAHQGHIEVWRTVEQAGKNWFIGTNPNTIGPNDPLTFQQKSAWMEEIYPPIQGHIIPQATVLSLAAYIFKKLRGNENTTIAYITDDQDWAWSGKLLNQYNGVEGSHGYYKFAKIIHVPSPRVSSATALRDAARADDKVAFYHASGTDPKLRVAGKTYFDTVKEACEKYPLPVKRSKKVTEMDSQGYTGSRDKKSHSKYGTRDDYELGKGKEHTGKSITADKMIKAAKKAWDYATEPVDAPDMATYKRNRAKNIADIRKNKGVAEGSLEEYGDTARGQKMLTKVQKRAVDRMIKADDKRDKVAAKKNQDTANRAWERMTNVAEGLDKTQKAAIKGMHELSGDEYYGLYQKMKDVAGHDGKKQTAPNGKSDGEVKDKPFAYAYTDVEKAMIKGVDPKAKQITSNKSEEVKESEQKTVAKTWDQMTSQEKLSGVKGRTVWNERTQRYYTVFDVPVKQTTDEGWFKNTAAGLALGAAAMGGAQAGTTVDDPSWHSGKYPSHIKSDHTIQKQTGSSSTHQKRISDVTGPNAAGEYKVTVTQNGKIASQFVTKTPPPDWMMKEQDLDEASLATMRDFFAGDENARDPFEITKQRLHFAKDAKPTTKKEFRSQWEYEQWLKQNKLKQISGVKEDEEAGEVKKTGQLIPFPQGTTKVAVSDVYDWYKLGQVISDLDDADPSQFGQGAPETVIAFGSEEEEHKLLPLLQRLGLKLKDIDQPVEEAYHAGSLYEILKKYQ